MKASRHACIILRAPAKQYSLVEDSIADSKLSTSRAADISNPFTFAFPVQPASLLTTENFEHWKRNTALSLSGNKSNALLGNCTHNKLLASLDELDLSSQFCSVNERYSWLNNNNLNIQRASQLCKEVNRRNLSLPTTRKSICLTHRDVERSKQQSFSNDIHLRNVNNKISTPKIVKPVQKYIQLYRSSQIRFLQSKKSPPNSLNDSNREVQKIFQVDRFRKRIGMDIFLDSAPNKKSKSPVPPNKVLISEPDRILKIETALQRRTKKEDNGPNTMKILDVFTLQD